MRSRGSTIVLILVFALVLAAAGWATYRLGQAQARAECELAAKKQREKEAQQAEGASITLEKGNAKAKVVFRTITQRVDKIIDRPVYRNLCLDTVGVQLANAALGGPSATAGESDKPVPRPDAAKGRDRGIDAEKTD